MSFQLRREEVLDGEQLKAMLAQNPARAAQAILMAAKHGIVEGQALLGQILLDGRGIERDVALAFRWFGIAAEGGHLMARNMLGRCLEHGWGCTADARAAATHYRLAAEAGLDWGLYNYANLLATGRGVEQDHGAAFSLYLAAAQSGHAKSMNLVGRYLEVGVHCARDYEAACLWYKRSAQGGDFRGQFSYASVLLEAGNVDLAVQWFRRALHEGNLNFLRVGYQTLLHAQPVEVRELSTEYKKRIDELSVNVT
ncbi:tetratricopeptide repeat protein [Pseudomonas sp. NPDC096917]|uniref:tetratricopeptide repeat protein n=1 Tax=Pseudomonas sp. NPDC096917 TaxID=3364483 RepID=UPI00383B4E98